MEATNLLLISTCTMYDDYTCKYYISFLRIKCNFEFYQREFMVYGKQGNFEVFERIITLKLLITTFIILEFMRKNLQLISRICMSKILNKWNKFCLIRSKLWIMHYYLFLSEIYIYSVFRDSFLFFFLFFKSNIHLSLFKIYKTYL